MNRYFAGTILAAAALLASATAAWTHEDESAAVKGTLDADRAFAASQQAIGRTVGNHRFVSAKGTVVTIDGLRGKPIVASLIYTSCDDVCPLITQQLAKAVEEAQGLMGVDRFTVLTIGIDTRNDTPMRMAAYARAQGVDLPNWLFLSADEGTIAALAEDLGFSFMRSGGGFRHISQTTILDRDGRVYRQVYGTVIPIQMFMEPLKEAVYGTVGTFATMDGLFDRIRFLCTVYDPTQGRYRISYAIVMAFLTGIVSLGATAIVLSRAWLNSRRA
jgi:protein SCO1/2